MSKYRNALPQMDGGTFLSDGGMETTLIFHDGRGPAAFRLVRSARYRGRPAEAEGLLRKVPVDRARQAASASCSTAQPGAPTPTGAPSSATTQSALKAINVASIALLEELRAEWENAATPCVISGAIGPRGDGYKAGNMDAAEAEAYHARADRSLCRHHCRHGVRLHAHQYQRGDRRRPRGESARACLAPSRSPSRPTAGW